MHDPVPDGGLIVAQPEDLLGQGQRPGRRDDFVVDDRHLTEVLSGPQYFRDEVVALCPGGHTAVKTRGPDDIVSPAIIHHGCLAGRFGQAVYAERAYGVGLDVRRALRAVEYVVGADVHKERIDLLTRLGKVDGADGVHFVSLRRVLVTPGSLMKCGRIHHKRRLDLTEQTYDVVRVGDLEIVVSQGNNVVRKTSKQIGA
jgi:hypothetical protein